MLSHSGFSSQSSPGLDRNQSAILPLDMVQYMAIGEENIMAEESCTHDCSSCGKNCADRKEKFDFSAKLNAASSVKKVIAVASGKGGVGKSFVTTMLAASAARKGFKVGILDADITGPSIPKAFGLSGGTIQSEHGIEPVVSNGGIRVMSLNMLVEDPTDPVVWRGPVIAGAVKQFWTEVHWGDLDVMFVDMPPGTGDVPLTVFQSLPVDGVVIVASPQKLVEMMVGGYAETAASLVPENYLFLRYAFSGIIFAFVLASAWSLFALIKREKIGEMLAFLIGVGFSAAVAVGVSVLSVAESFLAHSAVVIPSAVIFFVYEVFALANTLIEFGQLIGLIACSFPSLSVKTNISSL